MDNKTLAKYVAANEPCIMTHRNFRLIRKTNGKYLVSILDYDEQVKMIGEKLLIRIVSAEEKEIFQALQELEEESK